MYSRVVTVSANTSAGNQDITFSGGTSFTPKAAIIQWSGAVASDNTFVEGLAFGYGFTDGTNSRCVACVSEDGTTAADTARAQQNNAVIVALNQTGTITTVDALASFGSWLTNGIRINWSNPPTAAMRVTVTLLGGSDLTNVTVGTVLTTTGASCSVSGLAYQPEWGMFLCTGITTENAGSSTAPVCISLGAVDVSENQWCQTWNHADAATTDAAKQYYSHDRCVTINDTAAINGFSVFGNWDATGFTLTNTDAYTASYPIYYLIGKGGEVKVGNNTEPASTGQQTITTSTSVKSVIILGNNIGTANTISNGGNWISGMGDSLEDECLSCSEIFASDPMVTTSRLDKDAIYVNVTAVATATSSTIDDEASLDSVSSTGFTLDWTNIGQARPFRYITFGGILPETYFGDINEPSVSVSQTLERLQGIIREITESGISSGETLTRVLGALRTITESAITSNEELQGTFGSQGQAYDVQLVEFPEEVADSVQATPFNVLQSYIPIRTPDTSTYSIISSIVELTEVTKTLSLRFDLNQVISDLSTLRFNINNTITDTSTLRFNITNTALDTSTLRYDINQAASDTLTLRYNIEATISDTLTILYNINQIISDTSTLRYNINTSTSDTLTLRYNLNQAVSDTLTTIYNIQAEVNRARTLLYNIQAQVSDTSTLRYNITSTALDTLTTLYNINAAIQDTLTARFDILQTASDTSTLRFDIRAVISDTITLLYDIEAIGAVIKSLSLIFNIIAQISDTSTLRYNINTSISDTATFRYNIQTEVIDQLITRYNILMEVADTSTLRYNITSLVSDTSTLRYDILAQISDILTTRYDIIQQISNTSTLRFNITSPITDNLSLRFNVTSLVQKTNTIRHDIIQEIIDQNTIIFNITQQVQDTLTLRQDILQSVIDQLTSIYSINAQLVKNIIIRWNLGDVIQTVVFAGGFPNKSKLEIANRLITLLKANWSNT